MEKASALLWGQRLQGLVGEWEPEFPFPASEQIKRLIPTEYPSILAPAVSTFPLSPQALKQAEDWADPINKQDAVPPCTP